MFYKANLKKQEIIGTHTKTNILSLIQKSKSEKKEEKLKNVLIVGGAISALAISGLIISF